MPWRTQGDRALEGLNLRLSANPGIVRPKSWTIDRLAPDEELTLGDLGVELDIEALSGLDETELGTLTLTLTDESGTLAEEKRPVEFLAKDQWGGLADMDRLLAAYVSPNDAAVAGILRDASRLLEAAGHDGSMEGYQSGDPGRAWMIAGAIWSAATGLGLTYANPPASFESHGQKISLSRQGQARTTRDLPRHISSPCRSLGASGAASSRHFHRRPCLRRSVAIAEGFWRRN